MVSKGEIKQQKGIRRQRRMYKLQRRLKLMKRILADNGYTWWDVVEWAKEHPKFAKFPEGVRRTSALARTFYENPKEFMFMIRQEIPQQGQDVSHIEKHSGQRNIVT
jgi:hypothetical protein